jgi:hypothetical protein
VVDLDLAARVDDAILCAADKLRRIREQTLRASIRDCRATYADMAEVDPDAIWKLRIDRADALLFREDEELRKMARTALERER